MSTGQDPYKYFSIEARELLQQLEQGVLGIEKGADQGVLVPKLLRYAHTLKGAARVVRHKDIAELAHAAEDVLVPFRDGSRAVDGGAVNQLLTLLDTMSNHIGALGSTPTNGKTEHAPVEKASEESFRTIRAEVADVDLLLAGISAASVQFNTIRSALSSLEQMQGVANVLIDQLGPRSRGHLNGNGHAADRARSLAEELGILSANLGRNLLTCTERLDREMHQLRVAAEHLRLLPASTLFPALERTARDAAQSMGKRVVFEATGGEVRLDAHVLAHVHSVLTQAVRNAVAHGIETEIDRIGAGKQPAGKITIEVGRRGSRVAFHCRDDGRGVDPEAVRQAMRKRGATAAEIDGLATPDLLKLLLRGGYSTARNVTEVSGRGIGMDVIRDAAAQLGATVKLDSQLTRGSILEFVVAVSRTSFDALLVETNGAIGALPLDSVKGTLRVRPKDIVHAPTGNSILYEGNAIPYRPLSAAPGASRKVNNESAVVVDGGGKFAAIGVDRLVGVANIMQRPIPRFASTTGVVAGASLDVEGNPQIVFDPIAIVANAHNESTSAPGVEEQPSLPVLIIDDSLTTRMLEQSILESAGYTVDVATSAEEGLQKAKLRQYALFLVDVEMPGMDGFTFVQTTRMDPALSATPAILVTSRNLQEDFRRGEAVGASAYMVKSEFDQEKLLRTIRGLVRRSPS